MKIASAILSLAAGTLLTACITTTTGSNPEKWERSERAALHTQMGVNYLQQGQVKVAREELELALNIAPDSSVANHAMAKLQLQLGNLREAGAHYARAVRYNPDNIPARNDYGFFLCSRQEFEKGLEQLTAALNHPLNKTQYISLYGAAECERQAGNTEKAVGYYETALRLQPDMRPALLKMAYIQFDRGAHLKTRAYLERFFADNFYTDESLFLAVRNELALERRDLAADYARLLRTRFPNSDKIAELQGVFRDPA